MRAVKAVSGRLTVLCLLCLAARPAAAAPPDAGAYLQQLRDALPRMPIEIEARLELRGPDGRVQRSWLLDMTADWSSERPDIDITLSDGFGDRLADIALRYSRDSALWSFDPPEARELLAEAAVAPEDISLSFLWWPDARLLGFDTVKGRHARIVELKAPAESPGDYQKLRLWIDTDAPLLLRARGFDAAGEPVRTMEVKSFRRVSRNHWTLLRADWYEPHSELHTVLHIRDAGYRRPERDPALRR